jgi:hypothetical protein
MAADKRPSRWTKFFDATKFIGQLEQGAIDGHHRCLHPELAMLKRLRKKKKPTDVPEDRGDSAAAAKSPTRSEISRIVSAVTRKRGKKSGTSA